MEDDDAQVRRRTVELCGAQYDRLRCTLVAGHHGFHEARDVDTFAIVCWEPEPSRKSSVVS